MSFTDTDDLLREVSGEDPCGEDLSYDSLFVKLEQAAQPWPEQLFGDSLIPAEGPDWP